MSLIKFYLMNKNKEILIVSKEKDSRKFCSIEKKIDMNYAPFSVSQCKQENEILNALNFWYANRSIPDYRDNKEEIIKKFKLNSIDELVDKDYSLSLSDQYWLKPIDADICWDTINYFHRDYDSKEFFDATYGDGSFKTMNIKFINSDMFKSPNNTLGGQLKKVWVKIDDKNYLFKGAGSLHNFEQINEVLASNICKILNVPFVSYELKQVNSKRHHALVSVCECMIDDKQEMIPAYEILTQADALTKSPNDYALYLRILEKHNVPHAKEYLEKMFMLDYIMLNEDRHLGNFGIIRNVETLAWESVCPIYDTGRSMNTNVTENYWDFSTGEVKCFTSSFVSSEILPRFFTVALSEKQIKGLKELIPLYVSLLKENQSYLKLFDVQIEKLKKGLEQRIDTFEKVMVEKKLIKEDKNIL
ncbi:MAG: hypothetical protein EOM50_06770 [Erysipelotrichia bacterium]|nr:hypothetical protein [Erysipelotrichia bacterium]NCC54913.1 hypothetical protein [Erysipelotrichia bacterium]